MENLGSLREKYKELKAIQKSLTKSTDIGIISKIYFSPILSRDISETFNKINEIEERMYFHNNEEEHNESN